MSKSTRKRTTPAVTLRVIQGGAVCKPSPRISAKTATHAELRAELRRLRAEHSRLITIEMGLEVREGEPGYGSYKRACQEAERSSLKLDALTSAVMRRPVNTWDDVALLAEAHLAQCPGTEVTLLHDYIAGMTALEQLTLARLLEAVLKLGGSSTDIVAVNA